MKTRLWTLVALALSLLIVVATTASSRGQPDPEGEEGRDFDQVIRKNARQMIREGREIFRFDTFGDEAFWGGTLRLHEAIAQVSPATALAVGLKVDVDALPEEIIEDLKKGEVDLNNPATTLALLRLNAVVGVTGFFEDGRLSSMGIQCALCHSVVDNSFSAPGIPPGNIGWRLDGWANRDLNVGAIVNLAPDGTPSSPGNPATGLTAVAELLGVDLSTVRFVLQSWGAGKFDAELFMDGKALNIVNGVNRAPTLIPPAFGLAGVNLHTWTGWGSVTHWNAFVANLEMHGKGTFFDPRLNNPKDPNDPSGPKQFPIAAAAGFGNVRNDPDLITSKLAALHFYQLAIPAPVPPEGSDEQVAAAARGEVLFKGKADCARCHVPPLFTEPGWNMHTPAEIGIDDFQAERAPDKRYRTSPLKGLWTHQKGGFFHDGRFATLGDVVNHYNNFLKLNLTGQEKADLIEYLKSL